MTAAGPMSTSETRTMTIPRAPLSQRVDVRTDSSFPQGSAREMARSFHPSAFPASDSAARQLPFFSTSVPSTSHMNPAFKESGDRHYSSVKSKYFAALNIAPDSHARRTSDPPKPTRSDSIDIQQQSSVPPPMFRMDESQDSLLRSDCCSSTNVTPGTSPSNDSIFLLGDMEDELPTTTTTPKAVPVRPLPTLSQAESVQGIAFVPPHLLTGQDGFSVKQRRNKRLLNPGV